jgi:hypothetical protein
MHVSMLTFVLANFSFLLTFSVNSATRLEAHISYESKSFNLEQIFVIDTVIYILNRLFKFHQTVGGKYQLLNFKVLG